MERDSLRDTVAQLRQEPNQYRREIDQLQTQVWLMETTERGRPLPYSTPPPLGQPYPPSFNTYQPQPVVPMTTYHYHTPQQPLSAIPLQARLSNPSRPLLERMTPAVIQPLTFLVSDEINGSVDQQSTQITVHDENMQVDTSSTTYQHTHDDASIAST